MGYGYINEDGEFISNDERPRAAKCEFCGGIVEEIENDEMIDRMPTELIHARLFEEIRDNYTGSAPACEDCIRNGVGEPGEDFDPGEVFEESDDETVEL